jgi:REP element-mobilizing transposase RayT
MSTKTELLSTVGNYVHVYNRGVNREEIFFSPRNYNYFTQRLKERVVEHRVALHAYCLMPNHFHLILQQSKANAISDFMKGVCDGYAKAINREQKRSGHLFEGKFKFKPIEDSQSLLYVSRYVHMNPVHAHLVKSPIDWMHSSCREYCGLRNASFVTTQDVLSLVGSGEKYFEYLVGYSSEEEEKMERFLFG